MPFTKQSKYFWALQDKYDPAPNIPRWLQKENTDFPTQLQSTKRNETFCIKNTRKCAPRKPLSLKIQNLRHLKPAGLCLKEVKEKYKAKDARKPVKSKINYDLIVDKLYTRTTKRTTRRRAEKNSQGKACTKPFPTFRGPPDTLGKRYINPGRPQKKNLHPKKRMFPEKVKNLKETTFWNPKPQPDYSFKYSKIDYNQYRYRPDENARPKTCQSLMSKVFQPGYINSKLGSRPKTTSALFRSQSEASLYPRNSTTLSKSRSSKSLIRSLVQWEYG